MNITLFIVDDEELIRNGLLSLPWDEYDIDILGTAENGVDALEKIKQLHPDIVISDIEMPNQNGLWLAENVLTIYPRTKFIFLTAFNTFAYIHKALQLKVSDYILKPIKKSELLGLVTKTRDTIINEKQSDYQMEVFYNNLKECKFFLKSWFFDMVSAFYSTHDINENFDFLGTSLSNGQFCVVLIKLKSDTAKSNEQFVYYTLFQQLLNVLQFCDAEVIPFLNNNIITLVFRFDSDFSKAPVTVLEICDKLHTFLSFNTFYPFTIAIGKVLNGITNISRCNISAENTMFYDLTKKDKQIIYAGDLEFADDLFNIYENIQKKYSILLSHGSDMQISELLKDLFSLFESSNVSLQSVRQYCLSFATSATSVACEASPETFSGIINFDFLNKINNCHSISALCDILTYFSLNISKQIQNILQKKNISLVYKIKNYISDNYQNTITLEILSEAIGLSPNYISTCFYKETGVNFKDYLTSVRIQKAKELLQGTNNKIYEIAHAVGYEDTRYFSNLFNNVVGCLPSQYRKNHTD
ncbi:response regulator transcription factor [Ructibacterium gallinarum]|uniref:Stage 0 sporulation protein A homolog n=1 Tax=Ructibacterium gallinarum TaxID=2779355 RepID=A0A9D5M4H9_9FIRM|nr:response regulator [Ructibacterium gallinarum]MBE5040559.1 response regulator [Ructibacterium gallinarum]